MSARQILKNVSGKAFLARSISSSARAHNVHTEAQKRVMQQRAAAVDGGADEPPSPENTRGSFDERYRVIEKDHMFTSLADHRLVHAGSFQIDDFAQTLIRSADTSAVAYIKDTPHNHTRETHTHSHALTSTPQLAHMCTPNIPPRPRTHVRREHAQLQPNI